jgi:hypothetical protein
MPIVVESTRSSSLALFERNRVPPPGFKSVSLPDDIVSLLHHLHREVVATGMRNLPSDVVPPEYVDKVPVTVPMIVKMALLSLERKLPAAKKRRR